jgi:hypothetical protein
MWDTLPWPDDVAMFVTCHLHGDVSFIIYIYSESSNVGITNIALSNKG